jgi:hypothetical protein
MPKLKKKSKQMLTKKLSQSKPEELMRSFVDNASAPHSKPGFPHPDALHYDVGEKGKKGKKGKGKGKGKVKGKGKNKGAKGGKTKGKSKKMGKGGYQVEGEQDSYSKGSSPDSHKGTAKGSKSKSAKNWSPPGAAQGNPSKKRPMKFRYYWGKKGRYA